MKEIKQGPQQETQGSNKLAEIGKKAGVKHSSHAAISCEEYSHTVYSQVFVYTAECTWASWRERKIKLLRNSNYGLFGVNRLESSCANSQFE